jgi:hypothetical protein
MKNKEEILEKIKQLTWQKGYIYSLLIILFEDFHNSTEMLHELNYRDRLGMREASLLLGFMIQKKIDFTYPDSPFDFIQMKKDTYKLLSELHSTFMTSFKTNLDFQEKSIQSSNEEISFKTSASNLFNKGEILVEPIFYSGSGAYEFQYENLLNQKYIYDSEWLKQNREFEFDSTKININHICEILNGKSKKVDLLHLKETAEEIIESIDVQNIDEQKEDALTWLSIFQFKNLFSKKEVNQFNFEGHINSKKSWENFYNGLIDLFVVEKKDFNANAETESYLRNFSFSNIGGLNLQFKGLGNFNIINATPIINIGENRYIVPITYLLYEAAYESPYYWMCSDKSYLVRLAENRGKVGEEMTYRLLSQVFGEDRTFKSIKIVCGKDVKTDIDVLCLLGNKALCVQIKSKKLTENSRRGIDENLREDFYKTVQYAYSNQGLVTRENILERKAKFQNEHGEEIHLSESIDEVYIICLTTENYPTLALQAYLMLEKEVKMPYPLAITIFDLEILVHYLNDPYHFLHYVRQRVNYIDYFRADEERNYLGFYLLNGLHKCAEKSMKYIPECFGQLIDRNFFPIKVGKVISNEGDKISSMWRNEYFEDIMLDIKQMKIPQITDVIFHLLDLSNETKDKIAFHLESTIKNSIEKQINQDFTIVSEYVGITFISTSNNSREYLKGKVIALSTIKKYSSKLKYWIGFGRLQDSPNKIDMLVYDNHDWNYDEEIERYTNIFLKNN